MDKEKSRSQVEEKVHCVMISRGKSLCNSGKRVWMSMWCTFVCVEKIE